MEKSAKIYVAGHRGMVGSAIVRELNKLGFNNIVTRTSAELDLRNQSAVESFYKDEKPEYVIRAAKHQTVNLAKHKPQQDARTEIPPDQQQQNHEQRNF